MRQISLALFAFATLRHALSLSKITPEGVLNLVKESCVVLVAVNSPKTIGIVEELGFSILNRNSIPTFIVSWKDFAKDKYVKLDVKGLTDKTELVVLPRKMPDRSCLLKVDLLHNRLAGKAFIGLRYVRPSQILNAGRVCLRRGTRPSGN